MKIRYALFILGFVTLLFTSLNVLAGFAQPYSIVIRNIGTKKFSDSMTIVNKRKLTTGWVTSGNYKIIVNPSVPIPDKAIVTWQREGGAVYEKEIEIKSKLAKLLAKQEYYFIVDIDDNNVVKLKVVVCDPNEYWGNKVSSN